MAKVYIIHGWCANSRSNWFQWLKKELESKGFEVIIPDMPNTMEPNLPEWQEHLTTIVKTPDKNTYFIGHSLGCTAILRYLESLDNNAKIGGCVLVAGPFENEKYDVLHSFFEKKFDWKEIKKHCSKFVGVYSEDDHLVSIKHAEILEKNLGAELAVVDDGGHFLVKELPLVLDKFLEIVP